jgi:hypothetical protein
MVTASDGTFQIRQFTGNTFKTIQEAGVAAFPQRRDSVHVGESYTSWLGADGYMYAHGKVSHLDKEGLFKQGNIATSATNLTTGAILYASGAYEGFYVGWFGNSAVNIKRWYPHATDKPGNVNQGVDQGNVFTPVYPLPVLSTVENIRIYCLPVSGTGASHVAKINFYYNQNATASYGKNITRDEASKGYIDFPINKPFVTAVQFEIEFETSQVAGSNDFMPYMATIDYDATGAAKGDGD